MKNYVYILKSIKNGSYYVGSTQDPNKRLTQHNGGNVASTRSRRPYELVFKQSFESLHTAQRVEKKLKSWKRKDFLEKIIKDGEIRGPVAQW